MAISLKHQRLCVRVGEPSLAQPNGDVPNAAAIDHERMVDMDHNPRLPANTGG